MCGIHAYTISDMRRRLKLISTKIHFDWKRPTKCVPIAMINLLTFLDVEVGDFEIRLECAEAFNSESSNMFKKSRFI